MKPTEPSREVDASQEVRLASRVGLAVGIGDLAPGRQPPKGAGGGHIMARGVDLPLEVTPVRRHRRLDHTQNLERGGGAMSVL